MNFYYKSDQNYGYYVFNTIPNLETLLRYTLQDATQTKYCRVFI